MDRDGKQQEKESMSTYNYPKNINDEKEYFENWFRKYMI